jgi:phosphoinositide 3-/4-kinase-like protein
MSRDERALEAGLNDPAVPSILARGELEIVGLMPNSSNYTFLAEATEGDGTALGIYKPRRGEIPLWDFPEGTLCQREVAAFVVAQALGWPRVPPTVLRDGPEGIGSVQLFVEFDPEQHYFTLQTSHVDAFRDVAVFDAVINNADRKGGHCLLAQDGGIFLIDHGVCFNEEPKLRTVVWEYMDEPIAPARLADLSALRGALATGPLNDRLADLLEPEEVEATMRRVDVLLQAGEMPRPGLERPYPWPPI